MEVDNIYRERPAEVQCHRCKGFGHIAKNCATRPRLGERTPISQNVRCHKVANIESRSVKKGCKPVEYRGNTWDVPVATKRLPCYLGTMEGRVVRALVDSGATDNFVAKVLLKKTYIRAKRRPRTPTSCLRMEPRSWALSDVTE